MFLRRGPLLSLITIIKRKRKGELFVLSLPAQSSPTSNIYKRNRTIVNRIDCACPVVIRVVGCRRPGNRFHREEATATPLRLCVHTQTEKEEAICLCALLNSSAWGKNRTTNTHIHPHRSCVHNRELGLQIDCRSFIIHFKGGRLSGADRNTLTSHIVIATF